MQKTIIFVPGYTTSRSRELVEKSGWPDRLRTTFPDHELKILTANYDYFEHDDVNHTTKQLVELIQDTPGRVTLFAYSFGGFIARLTLQHLTPTDHDRITLLVTMGTPHRVVNPRQKKFLKRFPLEPTITVPLVAFGGWLDPATPPGFVRPIAITKEVVVRHLWSTHKGFFWNKKVQAKVLNYLKKYLN